MKDILSAHSCKFSYGEQFDKSPEWNKVTKPAMARLVLQHCLVHKMKKNAPEHNETKCLLIKTLLRIHLGVEEMPLFTFFNRIRQFPLAMLKDQCTALCELAEMTTPATAKVKNNSGGSED